MMRRALLSMLASILMGASQVYAQVPHVAENAPQDKPVRVESAAEKDRLDRALAPYVALARATYPQAKRRYLVGLPPRHSFFVSVELRDSAGRHEMVFLAVDSLARDSIYGRIWNQVRLVRGYRLRDRYAVPESKLLDWLITRPDGTEEGNVVGKFLDTY